MLNFYPLCYAAVLKNLAYYTQYIMLKNKNSAQHISYTNYIQVQINKSLLITQCYTRVYYGFTTCPFI